MRLSQAYAAVYNKGVKSLVSRFFGNAFCRSPGKLVVGSLNIRVEGVFAVGGLVLARIPLETVDERNSYYASKHADQIEAIDHDLLRENAHPTMTIGKPERQSRVTFGGGSTQRES